MELTSPGGERKAVLPERLAGLMREHRGWTEGEAQQVSPPARATPTTGGSSNPEEIPIPMTHIPGVVPGISMNRLKTLVADGTIPFTLVDRKKLVRPSDVRGYLESGKA